MVDPLPSGLALAIGSLPHVNAGEAMDLVLSQLPGSPHWPQLPRRSFLEQMEHQFSGFLPGIVIDELDRRLVLEVHGEGFLSSLEMFWERALAVESGSSDEHFALTEAFAPGFFAMEARLLGREPPAVVKGQATGPFTLGLGLMTTDDRAALFHRDLADVVVRAVACHAGWQARRLGRLGRRVIVSIDEPVLASFGSTAMITVSRDQVVAGLREAVEAVHRAGALASAHCCGNTDWSLLVDAGMDVLSFDAYAFAEKMPIYASSIRGLLERGGYLAWGIVPSTPAVRGETAESLLGRLREAQAGLVSAGLDLALLRLRTLITPSCGTGSLVMDDAVRVYELTSTLSSLWGSSAS